MVQPVGKDFELLDRNFGCQISSILKECYHQRSLWHSPDLPSLLCSSPRLASPRLLAIPPPLARSRTSTSLLPTPGWTRSSSRPRNRRPCKRERNGKSCCGTARTI